VKDLEAIKTQIEEVLGASGVVVFRGRSRESEPLNLAINWDTGQHPDPKGFLDAAMALGVKVIVYHHQVFSQDLIDLAQDNLESAELPVEDRRDYERTLRRLKGYVGFTASVELSFDLDGQTYFYSLAAPWYDELQNMMDDIDAIEGLGGYGDAGEDDGPLGGYFSQN
jgi:hypothetical protein